MLDINSIKGTKYYNTLLLILNSSPFIADLFERAKKDEFDIIIELSDNVEKNAGQTQPCLRGLKASTSESEIDEVGFDLGTVLTRFKKEPKPTYGVHIVLATQTSDATQKVGSRNISQGEFAETIIHELVVHSMQILSVASYFNATEAETLQLLIKEWETRRKEGDLSADFHHADMRKISKPIGHTFAQAMVDFLKYCEEKEKQEEHSKHPQRAARARAYHKIAEDALICYRIETGIKVVSYAELEASLPSGDQVKEEEEKKRPIKEVVPTKEVAPTQ